MPGIVEELHRTLEAEKPVLLLEGLGACAALLAGYFADPEREWPEELTFAAEDAWRRKGEGKKHRAAWEHLTAGERSKKMEEVRTSLQELRNEERGPQLPNAEIQVGRVHVVRSKSFVEMLAAVDRWLRRPPS